MLHDKFVSNKYFPFPYSKIFQATRDPHIVVKPILSNILHEKTNQIDKSQGASIFYYFSFQVHMLAINTSSPQLLSGT